MENKSTLLETQHLLLRRQQASDIEFLIELWSDPQVTCYMGGARDKEWLRSVFEATAQNPDAEQYDLWPVVEKTTAQVIGHCGLLDKEVEGKVEIELTYVLTPSAWGKGYATEIGQAIIQLAFAQMGLMGLIALIEPENESSERVVRRLGMWFAKEIVRPGGALRKLYAIEAGVHQHKKGMNEQRSPAQS